MTECVRLAHWREEQTFGTSLGQSVLFIVRLVSLRSAQTEAGTHESGAE